MALYRLGFLWGVWVCLSGNVGFYEVSLKNKVGSFCGEMAFGEEFGEV